MEIEIRKLTPDLAEDYVHFFDVTPHDVNIDDKKCYCVTWRSDDSYENLSHWFPTREERRSRAIEFVKAGNLQGYLAYHDNEIVGWCNANADCHLCIDYLSKFWPIEEHNLEIKVKSVFCFMVAPRMQKKGIATELLERVCKETADEGFDYVEAYTSGKNRHMDHDCRGHLALYEKCGFYIYAEKEGRVVVRKALK